MELRWLLGHAASWRRARARSVVQAILLSTAFALGVAAVAPTSADAATNQPIGSEAKQFTSMKDIRRLQRLLKLLANQNPARYAKVDPGIVDGTFGAGTVRAITTFQRIIGVAKNPVITRRLFAQILTAQAESPAQGVVTKPANPPDCAAGGTCPTKITKSRPIPPLQIQRSTAPAPSDNSKRRTLRYAQLASLKDEGRISEEWDRITRANPILLKDRERTIETANLAERGTYYRILVGPFDDFQLANTFCTAIRKKGQSCLVKTRTVALLHTAGKSDTAAPVDKGPSVESPRQADVVKMPTPAQETTSATVPVTENSVPDSLAASTSETIRAPVSEDLSVKPDAPEKPVEPVTAEPPAVATLPPPAAAEASQAPARVSRDQFPGIATVGDAAATTVTSDKAVAADKTPSVAPATALVQWLARADRIAVQSYMGPSIAAAAGTCFGLLLFVWRRRRHKQMMFESIMVDPWFDNKEHEAIPAPGDILGELKIQFESPDLVECRKVRDAFLDSLKKTTDSPYSDAGASENAMLVNRKLNQMIATDPSKYKSIFFNWIFLNHVAAMMESSDYTLRRLDPRIQQEFRLLASLFKIHLLELEARHHVRERLPDIFATLHQLEA